ncbi:MAG: TIGR01777 family oxidoreductase [Streptosporangiaceae bacterium]|nr:TIGR01777 family oxidoreductase [Streptosporangiaceae bacterium]
MKVAVTGSTGFLGTALMANLRADGHEILRLVRRPPQAADEVRWDPRAADAGLGDPEPLHGIDACVHLAGAGVANRRWTARYKAEVKASRVLGTRALAGVLAKLVPQPRVFVCASAIGWYGENSGVDETAPAGQGFLAGLVREWEAAADPARDAGIRVVHTRSGLVMGRDGGILPRFAPLARFGVCPGLGPGTQVMSWISKSDEIAAIRFVLDREDLSGPVNLTAPEPATNAEFTAALNAAMGRPYLPWLRVPAWLLRLAIGEASVELLTSSRVTPRRLLETGYEFRHPAIREALPAELARP